MAKPKQKGVNDGRTPSVMVRIPLDLIDRIDRERGMVPREPYIRDLIEQALPKRRPRRVAKK
jgi:hypothetical protein